MKLLLILLLSIACGVLGRLGGRGGAWWGNTKMRDLGCPLMALLSVLVLGISASWWVYFFSFGLMFGALCTYWDKLFGYDNFWFHGFIIGIAYFLFIFAGIAWWIVLLRAILLAVWMGGWSKVIKKDTVEEFGRYAIIPLLTYLLLI